MKPLICFYKNEQYIYCTDYLLLSCKENQSVTDFLTEIQLRYEDRLKVLRVNFETQHEALFKSQEPLYPSTQADVWILEKFELLPIEEILRVLNQNSDSSGELSFTPMISQADFESAVSKIKTDILNGRIYQANFTSAFSAHYRHNGSVLFGDLFEKFNSRYSALLPCDQIEVLCFSPELFLEKSNDVLRTEPIKGSTGPNQNFENDLLENEKENAELSMIVDLLRNDLNRISYETKQNAGAVVTRHRSKLALKYIQHTFSEVRLETKAELPLVLKCTLPGGSISGCPKHESLKVISELEKFQRQVYTGCIGWWQKNEFKLNLAIRTLIKQKQNVYYHAGCGIVFDSDPNKEWHEFLLKAGALSLSNKETLQNAESVLDTFSLSNMQISLLEFHIDRTTEACRLINPKISRSDIEKIYHDIRTNLVDDLFKSGSEFNDLSQTIFSLHLNPKNLKEYKIETRKRDDLPSPLKLQILKAHSEKKSSNQELKNLKNNYKWSDRQLWKRRMNQLHKNAHDVLLINEKNHAVETSRFNLFFYDPKEDKVFTPSLDSGCINGVFRRMVMKEKKIDLPGGAKQVDERVIHITELPHFEIFCGNSVRGLMRAEILPE